jgi:hypothetical protein
MVAVADQPAIHPRRCILPIPACGIIGCFEDHLPPSVADYHAELTDQIGGCYQTEGINLSNVSQSLSLTFYLPDCVKQTGFRLFYF